MAGHYWAYMYIHMYLYMCVSLVFWAAPASAERQTTACGGTFDMICDGSGVISIINSTSSHSTCNTTDGCCILPEDCTVATPEFAMTETYRYCERQKSCSVAPTQVFPLSGCPDKASNYQVVYYECSTSSTTEDNSPGGISGVGSNQQENIEPRLGLIVGVVAAVIVGVIVVIMCIFIVKMRKKKRKSVSKKQTNQHEEVFAVKTDEDGYSIDPEQPSSLQPTKPPSPSNNSSVTGNPSPPVSVAVAVDVLHEEAEYAVPNKPLAQAKAAERKKGKDMDKNPSKPPKHANDESEYGETRKVNPSGGTEYHNVRPTTSAREPSEPRHSDPEYEPDYDQIDGQSITYASIDHGDARADEEGEEQEDGYSTVDYSRPPAGQGGDDDDDDDVTLADNPVYN